MPAPPDVADATAAAARAIDPATPPAEALSLLGRDPTTEAQLTALHERFARQAAALGQSAMRIVADGRTPPVFHSRDDGWILLSLHGDTAPTGMTTWAKVTRSADGWRVDPRTICAAYPGLVLTDAPAACDD